MEHSEHVHDLANLVLADVSIERIGLSEHRHHARDLAAIPLVDVSIERKFRLERRPHVRELADIPLADVSIEVKGRLEIWNMFLTLMTFHMPLLALIAWASRGVDYMLVTGLHFTRRC